MISLLLPLTEANTLELHYWFKDESHSMDAIVQNKCEFEFLGIIKEVALALDVQIQIETEPLNAGGLKRWFKIASKSEKKTGEVSGTIIATLATIILVTPLTIGVTKITEKLIESLLENKEIKELEKEKYEAEIENLKLY